MAIKVTAKSLMLAGSLLIIQTPIRPPITPATTKSLLIIHCIINGMENTTRKNIVAPDLPLFTFPLGVYCSGGQPTPLQR